MRVLIVRNVHTIEEALQKIDRALSRKGQVILKSKKIGENMVGITLLDLREGKIEDRTFVIRRMGGYTYKFMYVQSNRLER